MWLHQPEMGDLTYLSEGLFWYPAKDLGIKNMWTVQTMSKQMKWYKDNKNMYSICVTIFIATGAQWNVCRRQKVCGGKCFFYSVVGKIADPYTLPCTVGLAALVCCVVELPIGMSSQPPTQKSREGVITLIVIRRGQPGATLCACVY